MNSAEASSEFVDSLLVFCEFRKVVRKQGQLADVFKTLHTNKKKKPPKLYHNNWCLIIMATSSPQVVQGNPYFDSYDSLDVHELMLKDVPRTEAYKQAIIKNKHLFKDKIVMDVGSGMINN